MEVIVFTSPKKVQDEILILTKMFEMGLDTLHLRKPNFTKTQLKQFIEAIPQKHRNKIMIHSNHFLAVNYGLKGVHLTRKYRKKKLSTSIKLRIIKMFRPDLQVSCSFHSLTKLFSTNKKYDYVFLSPVYNSISKTEYKAAYKERSLKDKLAKTSRTIIGLGGMKLENIENTIELGFKGMAFLGSIWEDDQPLEYFKKIMNKLNSGQLNVKQITHKVSGEK